MISDLYDEPSAILDAVKGLRYKGNDLIVFHVLDPAELSFPYDEAASYRDLETGEAVPIIPDYLREEYRKLVEAHVSALSKSLGDNRIDYALLDTSTPLDYALFHYLSTARAHDEDPVTFLTPLFFLGALALAVPVIIHLTNREKKEVVEFPSLMFLRRIPYRSVRRQKLRHLFLFALRCLALLLLTIAFARPFFESPSTATAATLGPREVVLVIDHSYSMGYENRLEAAKQVARSRIDALGPEDRGSLVVFSDRAEILNQPSSDGDELKAILDGIELSARTTRYGPALKLAKRIVDESNLPRKEVVLLSDFQRLGWEGDEDVWLPAGTDFHYENVGSDAENAAVTGVILEREPTSGHERLTASARVTYKAPRESPPLETSISIELNSRRLQTEPLVLEPNSSTTVSFAPFTLPAGIARGTVSPPKTTS